MTVDDLLAAARAKLARAGPDDARAAAEGGAVLVDIRAESQRERDGVIPGARFVPRNVLEWRLDPASDHRDSELADPEPHVILFCNEGLSVEPGGRDAPGAGDQPGDRPRRWLPGVARGGPPRGAMPRGVGFGQ